MAALVPCPICGKESDFLAPPLGPFCSRRCKLVDLGQWLDGEYRISEPLDPDALDDPEAGAREGEPPAFS